MAAGILPLIGYSWFVFKGTYVWWSWDLVEPITYFMNLSVEMVMMCMFFLGTREEYSNSWMRDYLIERNLGKNEEYQALHKQFEEQQAEKDGIISQFQTHLLKNTVIEQEI